MDLKKNGSTDDEVKQWYHYQVKVYEDDTARGQGRTYRRVLNIPNTILTSYYVITS